MWINQNTKIFEQTLELWTLTQPVTIWHSVHILINTTSKFPVWISRSPPIFLKNSLNSVNRFCVALTSVEPFHTVYSMKNKSIFTMSKGNAFKIASSVPSTSSEKNWCDAFLELSTSNPKEQRTLPLIVHWGNQNLSASSLFQCNRLQHHQSFQLF